jgi:hypothetical protein
MTRDVLPFLGLRLLPLDRRAPARLTPRARPALVVGVRRLRLDRADAFLVDVAGATGVADRPHA